MGNIITFFIYRILRRKLKNFIEKIDEITVTPSDFCVIGYCEDFSRDCDYTQNEIEREIKDYFSEYEITDVQYVNVSYNVKELYELYEVERLIIQEF